VNNPSIREINPFGIGVEGIWLVKYDRSEPINLLPQFLEINIYQSLFTPVISGELLIYDPIGLFVNYPMTGEESIIVRFKETAGRSTPVNNSLSSRFPFGSPSLTSLDSRTFYYKITGIREIKPADNARENSYVLELASEEIHESTRVKVSHCYTEKSVSDSIQEFYLQYIDLEARQRVSTPNFGFYSKKLHTDSGHETEALPMHVIIPNLRPFNAVEYFRKKAISKDSRRYHTWVFFENFYGFFFTTIQSIIEDQINSFGTEIANKRYIYNSNFEIVNDADPTQIDRLLSRYDVNKRFSETEKSSRGYFRNQTITINPDSKDYPYYEFTDSDEDQSTYLYQNKVNTKTYREILERPYSAIPVRNKTFENAPRLIYKIETQNAVQNNNEDELERIRDSHSERYLTSLNQIDISIVVPGDLTHNVGELIYVEFPELHGFNRVEKDKYISGYFLVTEIRHTVSVGGKVSSVLRINKDSFSTELESMNNYALDTVLPRLEQRTVIDPATGQPETEGGE